MTYKECYGLVRDLNLLLISNDGDLTNIEFVQRMKYSDALLKAQNILGCLSDPVRCKNRIRSIEIYLLVNMNYTYRDIAKMYNISSARVQTIYKKEKYWRELTGYESTNND